MKETIDLRIVNKVGLHARPASQFVRTASKFKAGIQVSNKTTGGKPVNAKSILAVLTLGVVQDHEVSIEANGEDAHDAIQALTELIANNFGEEA